MGGQPLDGVDATTLAAASISDIAVRLDFRSGATRTYPLNPDLANQFVSQGALTKYGAALANESADTVAKWPEATDKLHERLSAGQWAVARGNGQAASKTAGVLALALVEFTGNSLEDIRAGLKAMSGIDRKALAQDKRIRPIIERLEQERATPVDTDSLLSRFKEAPAA